MILSCDLRKIESFDSDSKISQLKSNDFRKIESLDFDFIFKDFKKLFNLCSFAHNTVF